MTATRLSDLRTDYDVVVCGARCAGASTAMLLARQGLRVLVVERARYGSDTLSTLALMRGGVLQLHRWGLVDELDALGTPRIRKTTFHYGDASIPIAIKPRDGVTSLYAPRRMYLDAMLVDAARDAGAAVLHGVRLVDVTRSAGRVDGVLIEDASGGVRHIGAGIVIGADGGRSTVANRVGAETYRVGRFATGTVYGFWRDLDLDEGFHWHFRDLTPRRSGTGAGAIPTNDGCTLVFASVPSERFQNEIRFDTTAGYHRVLAECAPNLARSVLAGRRVGGLRGFAGVRGYMRRSFGPGWALVGDAGYFKDPLTAHGITDALRDAELLATAVVEGSLAALASYQARRDRLSMRLFEVTDEIASCRWDLPAVKRLHKEMSVEMNREVDALIGINEAQPADASPVVA